MDDRRPDPDALLLRVQSDEARQARGKLKIFFGAAPGVGKTYTMLEAGREQAREGVDVLVGYIEPHVRPETQALVLGLDMLARREVPYRGTKLIEFDLDGAIARRPTLILVDELAHSNAPGLTYAKRWQDVLHLLEAGISVYTTLNVQHLESLRDVIAQITGVTVAETVPDSVFEQADEVELVDLPADGLLERLREGKVYRPQVAERAARNFFTKGNLIALRELAMRKAADRVGDEVANYRQEHGVTGVWPVQERLLVCVGPSPFSARLVRSTRRIAASLRAPWVAVHVETPADARLSEQDHEQLSQTLHLAEQLGGETATISGASLSDELVHYARTRNVTKIIVGKPSLPRWREWLKGSVVYDLARKCGEIDVYVISGEPAGRAGGKFRPAATSDRWRGYLPAAAVVALCTALGWAPSIRLAPANLIMVYLLGVVFIAARFGRGPSIAASVLSVAAFDFFFIPPYRTFAVHDSQYLLTFGVMLATALTISTLTARVAFQAESARRRERRTASLYEISHQLAAARSMEQVAQAAARHVAEPVDARVAILLPRSGRLATVRSGYATDFVPQAHDQAVAQWVLDHGEMAGHATSTLPGSAGLYLPLRASRGVLGVLGILPNHEWKLIEPEKLHLLETLAGLLALAIERVQLAAEAATSRIEMETEKLRSSLLSAVSHDLRTPLSVITGATSTLLEADATLRPEVRRALLESAFDEAERLNRLVANLLDMTRLDAGVLTVQREWQSIEEIIGSALHRLCRQLAERPVSTRLAEDLPFVPMDELLIEQVLVNLLENAIKYSPPGSPIEIAASAGDRWLTVEVGDQGAGIAETEREQIFEKFFRSQQAKGRAGAGLGLAIARGIVELHGGQISAQNRPAGGAVFSFTLPLAASAGLAPGPAIQSVKAIQP